MRFTIIMFTLLVTFVRFSHGAPLTIVENGNARAAIVVAQNEDHARRAGAAVQSYIEKMSGARLPIVTEGEDTGQPISIYVGHTGAAAAQGIAIPSGHNTTVHDDAFEEEGYVLQTAGNAIFIGGNSDGPYHGTLYGGYAFLYELGCRFYFPGDWGEVVPQQKTITVPDLDVLSRPDFAVRYIGLNPGWVPTTPEEMQTYAEWRLKVGMSSQLETTYPLVGDGFLGLLLPMAKYYDEHPEYFSMDKKGQRHKATSEYHSMLCLSNPDVLKESLKNIKTAFAEKHYAQGPNPHRISSNGFGVSPPDGSPYCFCEKCDKASQKFEYNHYVYGPQMSEEFYTFARDMAKEFPDKFVATMAYSLREMPPQGVELLPNMTVLYAPISCCAVHPNNHPSCWRRQEFVKMLRQYRRQTPHIYLYIYNPDFLTGLFVPERQTANVTVNIPMYRDIDIKGFQGEGRKAWMQTWTSFYTTARLLWDAGTDVEALKSDFYNTFFGTAAGPHVRAWWDAVETHLGASPLHPHEDFLLNSVYTSEFSTSIRHHIDSALAAETTPAQRERVEAVSLIADHLKAYGDMEAAAMNLDYAEAASQARRMFDLQAELNEIYSFFISETFPDNPDSPAVEKPPPFVARGRLLRYEELAAMTNGETGTKVADLPLEMAFKRDPFQEGVVAEWYAPDFDDTNWRPMNTHYIWDGQDPPLDAKGHHYDGHGWYRGDFDVDEAVAGKTINFHSGGIFNEGWVWINGKYIHHEPHKVWWWWNHEFDVDITSAVKPGRNTIAIRVWNKAEQGGMLRRGFFWSPTE
jgi:hypothetical protein